MTAGFVAPTQRVLRGEIGEHVEGLYTTIAFDPGGTTGWSLTQVWLEALRSPEYRIMDNVHFWTAGEFIGSVASQAEQMVDLVQCWPGSHVVMEKFVLYKLQADLRPVSIIGAYEALVSRDVPGKTMIYQMPALAMETISDDRLKAMGWWGALVGKEHARDAVRHNLTWLRRAKQIHQVESNAPAAKKGKR